MPIFVGRCLRHGEFEVIRLRWEPRVACPKCGRVVDHEPTAASARFIGGGFYATDYAKPKPAKDKGTAKLKQEKY
jgi:predicted nucleic acid-binding Zn ribbon protein